MQETIGKLESQMQKFVEDSEGRDGLILQQNQDISNLFDNEKATSQKLEEV